MLKRAGSILSLFITFVILLTLQKPLFALCIGGYTLAQTFQVMWHGLSMDMSMAGYLTMLPLLLTIGEIWFGGRWYRICLKAYLAIASIMMALSCVANIALYPYWNFPLDYTPVFYLTTAPAAAFASVSTTQIIIASLSVIILSLIYFVLLWLSCKITMPSSSAQNKRRIAQTIIMIILGGILFVFVRGGVTVSTMNLSRAYFSADMRLNHAAVNPLFSFMYSATHQQNDVSQFVFFDDSEAQSLFDRTTCECDSTTPIAERPDIHLIIAESFSANLLPSLGGEPIAMRIDSIGRMGWSFENIYSSSFRTDRGLTAILCGYPGLPTTSLLKDASKLDKMPSLPRELKNAGYEMGYFYGGDINFTNLNTLLATSGFDRIISDKDFALNQKLSKWGAHDDVLAKRALAEIRAMKAASNSPIFTVLQTSSSHEPFKVPGNMRNPNPRINAFEFADSIIGDYVDSLMAIDTHANSLIIIVPDHYGGYPQDLQDKLKRHHIPLIFTGCALGSHQPDSMVLANIGNQTDIAATVLAMLGLPHDQFRFSNNLLNPNRHGFAFFSEPTWAVLKTNDGWDALDLGADFDRDSINALLPAYLQMLYQDFSAR